MPFRSLIDPFLPDDSAVSPRMSSGEPAPEPSPAQVLYPEIGGGNPPSSSDSGVPYVSDSDRNHLRRVMGGYETAKQSGDPERFREALTGGIGGTLRSYPQLRPHLPEEAVLAHGDFQQAFDDERRNFTANGLRSSADDPTVIARAAAGKVLQALRPGQCGIRCRV